MTSFSRGITILLAVVLCSATATLDAEEKQKEEKSQESVRKAWNEDVADGTPEKPQNFQVFPESDSIMGVWDPPADGEDVDHYFVYVENEDMDDTTSLFFYNWKDLEACTNYTLGVKVVTSQGDMSEPALQAAQTLVGIPPEPQDLHVENYTHTTVTLAWEEPDTQCDIDHYKVRYQNEGFQPQDMQVFETTVEVSDLLPETRYTFSVYTSTTMGEGLAATVEQTTAPDTPGPPENLVAEGISSTAINVSWSAPNLEPDYYLVSSVPCMYDNKIVYDLTCLIDGLTPCQRCYITVISCYQDDDIKFPATTFATSKSAAPPPPLNCVVEVKEQYITVRWEKPSTPCILGTYNVNWTWKQLWGNGEEESDTVNTTGLSHTVYNLRPYHLYTFEIAASIDGTFGSPTSCSGTSLESPAGPPVLVSLESGEQGMAQVTWDSPAEENGEILKYGIFINGETNSIKEANIIAEVNGDVHSTTLSLAPCVSVGISVAAFNKAGWGEQSEVKEVTVVDDVLPKELRCPEPDPEVQVCWDPFSTTCPVSQYNLKWEGDVLWSDTADSNTTTLEWSEDEICYNISSTPYTKYSVELSVGTKVDKTLKCSSMTPMAAPGPPTLEELQTDNLSINVNWREPEEKNGVIINYLVEWTDWNGVHGSTSTDGNTFSSQIMEPSCGGKVDVTVKAKTVEFGEKSPTRSVYIANSISNLKCEPKNPGGITLSWDVNDPDCPIQMYNVTWSFESLWSDDKGSYWQSVNGNALSTLLESLPPYSTVSVEVHVDNSMVETSCFATTLQEAPGPPSLEELQYENFAIIVTWKEPEEKNGVITAYKVEWTEANGEEKTQETDGNTFSYQILDLSCGGEVVVTVRAKTVDLGEKSPPRSVGLVNSIMNLTCESTDPGEIALGWEFQDKQCPINSYNVTWSFDSLWSDDKGSNWTSIDGKESSITLTSLPAYSRVSVEFFYSYTQENARCTSITCEETSSPPTEVQQIANDTNSVTVSWSSPKFVRGKLFGWQLSWKNSTGEDIGTKKINDPTIMTFQIQELSPSEKYGVDIMALNGAGEGKPFNLNVTTASSVSSPPESYLGLILGVSIGGGIVLILLAVGGVVIYNKKHNTGSPISDGFTLDVIDSANDMLYNNQHQSSANQRFPPKSRAIDLGTNRELYPDNDNVLASKENSSGPLGDRRLSQQVSSSLPKLAGYDEGVNIRMKGFQEYNRRSSQPDLTRTSKLGMHGVKPKFGESGRRSSQQIDLGRSNFKEFGRRPSQQIDVRRLNPMEHGKRLSQQIDQERPSLGEYGRRPSQQIDLGRPIINEYGRRPSQQIDMRKPRSGEYIRHPSQQVDIGGKFLPSRSPQQPINTRPAYDHYKRRPSQQAEINMPSDRAFMRRPSQQFVTNFDGIQE